MPSGPSPCGVSLTARRGGAGKNGLGGPSVSVAVRGRELDQPDPRVARIDPRRARRHPALHEAHDAAIDRGTGPGEQIATCRNPTANGANAPSDASPGSVNSNSRYHVDMTMRMRPGRRPPRRSLAGPAGRRHVRWVLRRRSAVPRQPGRGVHAARGRRPATATGSPACEKAGADVVAKLSIKASDHRSAAPKAAFAATAAGRTLTVTSKTGDKIVTWDATDPIGKVVEVYASQYEDRVAVAYTVRRHGQGGHRRRRVRSRQADRTRRPRSGPDAGDADAARRAAPPEDPAVTKAVATARKAAKGKALAAWKAVLALDRDALPRRTYRLAARRSRRRRRPRRSPTLSTLAEARSAPDAIEWLVEARFDPGVRRRCAPIRRFARRSASIASAATELRAPDGVRRPVGADRHELRQARGPAHRDARSRVQAAGQDELRGPGLRHCRSRARGGSTATASS